MYRLISIIFLLNTHFLFAQYFPVESQSEENFSSAFGPRNLGTADYPANDPRGAENRQYYNYDFHAAIDIAAPADRNVIAIYGGSVESRYDDTDENSPDRGRLDYDGYIVLEHEDVDGTLFYTKYLHIENLKDANDEYLFENGETIEAGQIIAKIDDYGDDNEGAYYPKDHLDIRYYPTQYDFDLNYDNGAVNPGIILPIEVNSGLGEPYEEPIILDEQGNVITVSHEVTIENDLRTVHENQQGQYISFGVRTRRQELDIVEVLVSFFGWSEDGLTYYNNANNLENNLFNITRNPDNNALEVDYDWRINVGDDTEGDSDVVHNSTIVGIYPSELEPNENYHDVFFRWYLDEENYQDLDLDAYTLEVTVSSWDTEESASYIFLDLPIPEDPDDDFIPVGTGPSGGDGHLRIEQYSKYPNPVPTQFYSDDGSKWFKFYDSESWVYENNEWPIETPVIFRAYDKKYAYDSGNKFVKYFKTKSFNGIELESILLRNKVNLSQEIKSMEAKVIHSDIGEVNFNETFLVSSNQNISHNIYFKDPWYVDETDPLYYPEANFPAINLAENAVSIEFSTPSSIIIDSPYNGVLINITPDMVFNNIDFLYQISADPHLMYNNREWYFSKWQGNNISLINQDNRTSAIIFTEANSDVWPVYKGHLASNNSIATGYNNGRHVAREAGAPIGQEPRIHIVYEDNNEIWYTYSDDDGETFVPEMRLSSISSATQKHYRPSIALSENYESGGLNKTSGTGLNNVVHVVWETEVTYDGITEKGIMYRRQDFSTREWLTADWLYSPSWGFGDPVSMSYPVIFVGGGISGRNNSINVAFKNDSDNKINFAWLQDNYSWWTIQEVPGAYGIPTSSHYYTSGAPVFLIWPNNGLIKYSKASWNGNGYNWSSVKSLTTYFEDFLANGAKPSISYQSAGNYAHLTWQGFHIQLLRNELYYQKYDLSTSTPTPVGNISTVRSVGTSVPLGDASISFDPSNNNVNIFYDHNGTIYRDRKSGYVWTEKNFLSGKYPGVAEHGSIGAIWTKYSSAPYLIKSDYTPPPPPPPPKGGADKIAVTSGDSLPEIELTINKRFDYLLSKNKNQHEFISLTLTSTSVNEVTVDFDDNNQANTLLFSGSDDIEMNWKVFKKNLSEKNNENTVLMNINLVEGNKHTKLETYRIEDFINADEEKGTTFYYSALSPTNGFLEISFEKEQPMIFNMLEKKDDISFAKKSYTYNPDIIPVAYQLYQNYPNPFNPVTHIQFGLPRATDVSLVIYNTAGQKVAELMNAFKPAGTYEVVFNSEGIASGMYFYHLKAADYSKVKRMLLIR